MLRINAIPNTSAAKNYYRSNDYYVEGQEHEAHWHGKGAEMLGLSGQIKELDFGLLCENRHPKTAQQLTPRMVTNRRVGYDFTWSIPKSASVLYALGADSRLGEAFEGAVQETMAEMEHEMQTRVRKGGAFESRTTGNMIWAGFLHHTSRPINGTPDPQLHIHSVVFNATFDRTEGIWKAGEFGQLKADAPYFQAGFRARLAQRLQHMGYELTRTKDDFEITGVPERVIKEFSRRTKQIEQKAEDLGVTRPESKAKLGATTREAKKDGQTWESLLEHWNSRVTDSERQQVLETVIKSHREPKEPVIDNAQALDWSLRHLLERNSVVSQREVVTTALKHGLGSVTVEGILEEIGRRKDLIRREMDGRLMVSTQAVLNEENEIISFAKQGRGRWRPLSTAVLPDRAEDDITTLSPSQQAAIHHAWNSRDSMIVIRGAAGTGKTTLTKALLAGVDMPYVVLAPSAEASRGVLRREGVDPNADTLAKFLGDESMQEKVKGGLIVLDEASLAGAHDLHRLVKSAEQLKARVLLLGDRRQHKSVARGDVLALLEDKAKLKVAVVGEIRRQAGEYKAAVKLASDGRVADAFHKLDALGWIKGQDALVDDYMQGLKTGKSQLVVAPTHAEGDTVTQKLRERLKQEGIVHGEERQVQTLNSKNLTEAEKGDAATLRSLAGQTAQFVRHGIAKSGDRVTITEENAEALAKQGSRFVVYESKEMPLAAGDTVRMTANDWDVTRTHRLNNGAVYTVAGFTDKGVKLDNGWVVNTPHMTHGLVVTSHAAQGRTVDKVLIAQGSQSFPASDKSQFYVSISRGRQQATVFTDDKSALLEAVDRERGRILASELVRKPKHNLVQKKKRALAFMRDLINRFRDEPVREPGRVRAREREM